MDWCLALWGWLAFASVVAAALTVADKRAARRGRRRRSEASLLLWAALGGWVGMLLAMAGVRHKTRKPAFLLPFAAAAATWTWLALGWAGC